MVSSMNLFIYFNGSSKNVLSPVLYKRTLNPIQLFFGIIYDVGSSLLVLL